MDQKISFCDSVDGVRIAYAVAGSGVPLVKVGNWFTHLEFDWRSPVWRHVLEGLVQHRRLVRYDVRGTGLSDREVADISFERFVDDLAAVVDALELERFPLFAVSQGGAVSVAYAARHPERVSQLIIHGGFARGLLHRSAEGRDLMQTQRSVIRHGWGSGDPAYRQLFSQQFLPEGSAEQLRWFGELERVSATAEVAERIFVATQSVDVRPLLPSIKVPTLVLHCHGDRRVPFEMGRELAALIPNARLVPLESNNHLFLEHEPVVEVFFKEVAEALGDAALSRWKPKSRAAEPKLQVIATKVEASPVYKLLTIAAVIATVVTFVGWVIA